MSEALLVALFLQAGPVLEKAERLVGGAQRPLAWAPLAVTIRSAAPFEGDVVARSSLGFSVVRRVRLAAGGLERVLLPALDPVEVTAGASRLSLRGELSRPDLLVGVDERLPYAAELKSEGGVEFVVLKYDDLKRLLPGGLLEAMDLLLLSDAEGLALGAAPPAVVAPAAEAARKAVEDATPGGPPRIGVVDAPLWELAPRDGWVPSKKSFAVFFAAVYAFAGFAALTFLARRHPRWAPAVAAGVAALFVLVFLLFFPRGQLWIVETPCEVVPPEGDALDWRVWFAGAPAALETRIAFPRLVKPVFAQTWLAGDPFTLRVGDRGCEVEALRLRPNVAVCFAGAAGGPPSLRAGERLPGPLYGATVLMERRNRFVGDLPSGALIADLRPGEDGPPPREPEVRAFGRFARGDTLMGWLDRGERGATDVASPDLADARRRPRFWMQRLK